ncbi:hypothetical protein Dimus_026806, partial [Dionaea muscipula]
EWIKCWLGFGPCIGPQVLVSWKKLKPIGGYQINNNNNSRSSKVLARVRLLDKQAHHLKD